MSSAAITSAISNAISNYRNGRISHALDELDRAEHMLRKRGWSLEATENLLKYLRRRANNAPLKVVVNLTKINMDATLGVLIFGKNVINAIAGSRDLVSDLYLFAPKDLHSHPIVQSLLKDNIRLHTNDEYVDVEVKLHHFQLKATKAYKVVTVVHDFHVFDVPWKYGDAYRMQGEVLANIYGSDVVITHFPRSYDVLNSLVGDKAQLTVSPTMLPEQCNSKSVSKDVQGALNLEALKVLYPAQFQRHKNHFNLLKALRLILDTENLDVSLLLTGSIHDHEYFSQVSLAIEELGLNDSVCILGMVSDNELHHLYQNCDLVVQPSLAEGGAYIAQEAVQNGKRVVLSNIPQVKQHLKRIGVECPLFDPREPANIAKVMSEQLVSSDRGDHGDHLFKDWTWDVFQQEIRGIMANIRTS